MTTQGLPSYFPSMSCGLVQVKVTHWPFKGFLSPTLPNNNPTTHPSTTTFLTLGDTQRFLDEAGSGVEVRAEVKGRHVLRHHAAVDHVHVGVVGGAGVHVVPGSLGSVEDVGDAQPPQQTLVLRRLPARTQHPRLYTFTRVLLGHIRSFQQDENHNSSQILHAGTVILLPRR